VSSWRRCGQPCFFPPAANNVVSGGVLSTSLLAKMDFTEATDRLTKGLSLADLARELGASYGLIRQARMDPTSPSYRKPPEGWEAAVARLAASRAEALLALKSVLEQRS
jgi:hypothetical protein